ncbi:unnamed protein product [Rotaria sordida]|uniref:HAT C-terminal dimerisation domain-containing protein n=1 Tax=Rotaria sordida TaxID=392033 RepID=A0A815HX65_9BILA|nr:unnamed protein product [Rotaria sordida]CAF1357514.1 unnamed protein product [Rotaria sordida]CAF1470241.1 unnamed protein product [Rotaria sordida]CAF3964556.1 unnamed protein product [Rotaria sordida]CAF4007876.1 unnamed protein product [Rotaria sordida]
MINPDNLSSGQIQRKLRAKEFILMNNPKATHELWVNDISLVGVIDNDGKEQVFDGWAVCKHCLTAYRTHSKKGATENRKNYGLTSLHTHVKEYRSRSNKTSSSISTATSAIPKQSAPVQTLMPRFAYNKNQLNEHLQKQLKDAELKFVTVGSHSFNALENDGVLELAQTAINIGATMGMVNIRDIFYGRKTIRNEAITKFNHFSNTIRQVLDEPIKNHCVAATCDMWTDDYIKRCYIDFTVFWTHDNFKLSHCLLRCKHFSEDSKTGINIWQEIKSIFESFNLSFGDTPIVTDQGSNMIAAFNITQEARLLCMAHRCNTTLETAWNREDAKNPTFAMFNAAVRDIRKYVNQTTGIQDKLPETLKGGCGTRPWRSYFDIHDSLNNSFEELNIILREREEQYRLFNIDLVLLNEIAKLMRPFSMIFDKLEMADQPTLQNVMPSYYRMLNDVQVNTNDHKIINELKSEIRSCLDEKYLPSILQIHWISTYLDPSLKSFFFISDSSYLEIQKKQVRKGLHILASDIVHHSNNHPSSQDSFHNSPPSKRMKDDPFADFRNKRTTQNTSICDQSALKKELDRQIQIYDSMEIDNNYDNNPFTFWRNHKDDLSFLAQIAKSVLVIPASSVESERHFSIAGQIVTELRSSLDPNYVEALVVLKEAYINKMWPTVV